MSNQSPEKAGSWPHTAGVRAQASWTQLPSGTGGPREVPVPRAHSQVHPELLHTLVCPVHGVSSEGAQLSAGCEAGSVVHRVRGRLWAVFPWTPEGAGSAWLMVPHSATGRPGLGVRPSCAVSAVDRLFSLLQPHQQEDHRPFQRACPSILLVCFMAHVPCPDGVLKTDVLQHHLLSALTGGERSQSFCTSDTDS